MNFSKSFSARNISRRQSAHVGQANEALREISGYTIGNVFPSPELIFEKLLSQPVKKPSSNKDSRIWKPDIESLKSDCNSLKVENNRLQNIVIGYKLEIQNLRNQVKRLDKYQKHYQQQTKKMPSDSLTAQIYRKKILKLKLELSESMKQLTKLKRIPESSIFKECQIEKQQLLEESVRLKAYIKAQLFQKGPTEMTEEVIRNLKEELEKEKGALRLLESENKTVKAKNNIVKKTNKQLSEQNSRMAESLKSKEGEVSSLAHQNQNLLLKRFSQFKIDQETREREEINNLQTKIKMSEECRRQLEVENYTLKGDVLAFKDKQKVNDQLMTFKEQRYQEQIKSCREQLYEAQEKYKSLKDNYMHSKTYAVMRREKTSETYTQKQKLIKPIKHTELEYQMLCLKHVLRKSHLSPKQLICNPKYSIMQMCDLLREDPIRLDGQSALKVARYMIEDDGTQSFQIDMTITGKRPELVSILENLAKGFNIYKSGDQSVIEHQWKQIMKQKERWIRRVDEQLKVSTHIHISEIKKILELGVLTQKQMAYLETEIFDRHNRSCPFSLQKLKLFIKGLSIGNSGLSVDDTYFV